MCVSTILQICSKDLAHGRICQRNFTGNLFCHTHVIYTRSCYVEPYRKGEKRDKEAGWEAGVVGETERERRWRMKEGQVVNKSEYYVSKISWNNSVKSNKVNLS